VTGSVDPARMVKRFRRSAAGTLEQLPLDLRTPQALKVDDKNLLLNESELTTTRTLRIT
jgi:hypothetical protein